MDAPEVRCKVFSGGEEIQVEEMPFSEINSANFLLPQASVSTHFRVVERYPSMDAPEVRCKVSRHRCLRQ
jgi:hypothetical protein